MALCRRGRLSIFRGEVGSARTKSKLPQAKRPSENLIRLPWDYGAAVAQGTHNPLVVGSNPSGPIKKRLNFRSSLFFYVQLRVRTPRKRMLSSLGSSEERAESEGLLRKEYNSLKQNP